MNIMHLSEAQKSFIHIIKILENNFIIYIVSNRNFSSDKSE